MERPYGLLSFVRGMTGNNVTRAWIIANETPTKATHDARGNRYFPWTAQLGWTWETNKGLTEEERFPSDGRTHDLTGADTEHDARAKLLRLIAAHTEKRMGDLHGALVYAEAQVTLHERRTP